jgi:hypothetical protein
LVLCKLIRASVVLVLTMSCGSSPTGPSGADRFTWTVDGVLFEANDMGALRAPGGGAAITGANCRSHASLGITLFTPHTLSVGTHAVGNVMYVASWHSDTRTSEGPSWDVDSRGGSGTLTIVAVDSRRVSGSFSLEMAPRRNTPATGTKSVSGNFDLSFADNTIC